MNLVPKPRLVAYALFALVVFGVGIWSWSGMGPGSGDGAVVVVPGEAQAGSPRTGSTLPAAATTTVTEPPIYVHVAGAVRSPGVYRLPVGSRVFEALEAAGGPLGEGAAEQLPLAAPLTDGSRVEVPVQGETAVAGTVSGVSASGAGSAAAPGLISINRASAEELETLPGIGPKTAASIIAFREEQGAFGALEDLTLVSGIGPATFERVRELITL